MNFKHLLILAPAAAALVVGCQHHRHTPGEQIVGETQAAPAPVAAADPNAPVVPPPPPDAAVPPPPAPVAEAPAVPPAPAPSTLPATTEPADRGPRIYVAADADDATLLRNWQPVVNPYANGNVIAGPTYRIIAPPPRSNRWDDVYAVDLFQTVLTIPQMIGTPLWAFVTPPLTPVEYHGEEFPPSYTVDDAFPYYVDEKVPGMIQMKRDK
jgi:hypothetical protein